MINVTVNNTVAGFRVPRAKIHDGLTRVFEKSRKTVGISLVFVSDREIIRLHAKFLHLRSTTDVLTFVSEDSERILESEVYVCVDTARRQAHVHGVSVRNEIVRLCIHGALHAAGFDDHSPRDKAKMWKRQEFIVRATGA